VNDPSSTPGPSPSDLDRLRARYPGWSIEATWTSAGTGPDARRLTAARGCIRVDAWTAAELARQIEACD
jgi:hypothetical protein